MNLQPRAGGGEDSACAQQLLTTCQPKVAARRAELVSQRVLAVRAVAIGFHRVVEGLATAALAPA